MFGFGKRTPPLLAEVLECLRNEPQVGMAIAILAGYLPHGGSESFWFYLNGDEFDCHAAYTKIRGGLTVRHCKVAKSAILDALDEAGFFEMRDAKREAIDGLVYRIAAHDRKRSHHVTGDGILFRDQPQTKLFHALTKHFPARS